MSSPSRSHTDTLSSSPGAKDRGEAAAASPSRPSPLPTYVGAGVALYCADALTILPKLDLDGAVVITDPPYNVGIVYGEGTDDQRPDYEAWCAEWFAHCRRAEVVAVSPGIANVGLWTRIAGDPDWIIAWHKPAAMGRCVVGFNNWEPVLVWGNARGQASADVFTAPLIPDPTLEAHPCPKPLAWGTALVSRLSRPGDVVVDPFAGSGTVLRAAKTLGRTAIGIEVEERYCELAVTRLGQEVLDLAV